MHPRVNHMVVCASPNQHRIMVQHWEIQINTPSMNHAMGKHYLIWLKPTMEFEVRYLIMLPFCTHWFLKKWMWLQMLGEELFLDYARESDMQGLSKEVVVFPFGTNAPWFCNCKIDAIIQVELLVVSSHTRFSLCGWYLYILDIVWKEHEND